MVALKLMGRIGLVLSLLSGCGTDNLNSENALVESAQSDAAALGARGDGSVQKTKNKNKKKMRSGKSSERVRQKDWDDEDDDCDDENEDDEFEGDAGETMPPPAAPMPPPAAPMPPPAAPMPPPAAPMPPPVAPMPPPAAPMPPPAAPTPPPVDPVVELQNLYSTQVKAIIDMRCATCHASTSPRLTSFDLNKAAAGKALSAVNNGSMPLGGALSATEKATLVDFYSKLSKLP
jgi:hypothetical protein